MTATEQAKAYLATLAPHVMDRKAASVILELVSENDLLRAMLTAALDGLDEYWEECNPETVKSMREALK